MQLPDLQKKQVCFLDTSDATSLELSLRNENILITKDGETKNKIPLNSLLLIFVVGDITITSKLIQKVHDAGASLYLLKRNMETYASLAAFAEGNYLLRQKQYSLSESVELTMAKNIIYNKLRNNLALLRGAKIDTIQGKSRLAYKRDKKEHILLARDIASLRGVEGVIAKDFFGAYFANIHWYRRLPRSKVDENNILLDIGYTFLFHFIDSLLRLYGFDTYKGIYHKLFFQRKSLACDMMEPFRCIVDRALYKMHTLGQFDSKDFGCRNGRYYLSYKHNSKYAKIFLEEILRYKEDMYHYVRDHYYLIINEEGEVKPFIIR